MRALFHSILLPYNPRQGHENMMKNNNVPISCSGIYINCAGSCSSAAKVSAAVDERHWNPVCGPALSAAGRFHRDRPAGWVPAAPSPPHHQGEPVQTSTPGVELPGGLEPAGPVGDLLQNASRNKNCKNEVGALCWCL